MGEIERVITKSRKIDPPTAKIGEFTYLDISSIDNSFFQITNPKIYQDADAPSRAQQVVQTGDILFSTVRPYLKNIAMVEAIYDKQIASTGFCVMRSNQKIEKKLLFYYVISNEFINRLNEFQRGSSYPAVKTSTVFDQPIPLPPLPEQRRIAAKLDSLLGKLREARTLMDEARVSFALRRAAILHQAFSGKLTAQWRAEHPEIENAEVLVHELFKGKRTYSKGKHQENISQNIPDTWKAVELGTIMNVHSGENLTKSNMIMDGGIPVYGGNGIAGYHNAYNVAQKTIVIGRVGYYCGGVHLTEEKAWITDNAFIVKFSEQQMDVTYLFWLLIYSNLGQTSNSSAQPVISGKTIYPVIVPLPPLSEQREIARRIDSLLGHECAAAGLLDMDDELDLLEQSLLSRAFRGELGTNDPAEPPAI